MTAIVALLLLVTAPVSVPEPVIFVPGTGVADATGAGAQSAA